MSRRSHRSAAKSERTIPTILIAAAVGFSVVPQMRPAMAHPHVFVDARIGFVIDDDGMLAAIRVAWRFDPFHTLYILSFDGITPTAGGGLSAAAQADLARSYTDWQRGFDGFTKLSLGGEARALDAPTGAAARLRDGQLEISFTRALSEPAALAEATAEIAVYDASYYHAVSVAEPPEILASTTGCHATLVPFAPDAQTASTQSALSALEREETPSIADVGALFADRITLSCV